MMNWKRTIAAGIGLLLGIGMLLGAGRLALYAQDGAQVEEIRYFHQVIFDALDGFDGLDGVQSLVLTPDGAHLYAVGFYDDSLIFYTRDAESGKLTQAEILRRDTLDSAGRMVRDVDGPSVLILSPDGRYLYTANQFSNGISIFARDMISGRVTFVESLRDGGTDADGNTLRGLGTTYSLVISADGRFLYATGRNDDAVVTFARDSASGKLSLIEVIEDGNPDSSGAEVDGLDGAAYLSLSPDGNSLYVTSFYENALVTFRRDNSSGQLTFVDQIRGQQAEGITYLEGLSEPHWPLVSPDGRTLFVPARGSNQLFIFNRNSADGRVTYASTLQNGVADSSGQMITGLRGANFVTFGPDGSLYIAGYGDNAIVHVRQNEEGQFILSGELKTQKLALQDGAVRDTMASPTSLVIAPDNRFLYAAGFSSDSIATFGVEAPPASIQQAAPGWRNLWGIAAIAQPSRETNNGITGSQTAEIPLVDWITPVALLIGGLLSAGIWFLIVGRARP
jgi:6-phosphogluconolactonase (cycloisomerase 2 family)